MPRNIAMAIDVVKASVWPSAPLKYASPPLTLKHALQHRHGRRCRRSMPHRRVHRTHRRGRQSITTAVDTIEVRLVAMAIEACLAASPRPSMSL